MPEILGDRQVDLPTLMTRCCLIALRPNLQPFLKVAVSLLNFSCFFAAKRQPSSSGPIHKRVSPCNFGPRCHYWEPVFESADLPTLHFAGVQTPPDWCFTSWDSSCCFNEYLNIFISFKRTTEDMLFLSWANKKEGLCPGSSRPFWFRTFGESASHFEKFNARAVHTSELIVFNN